MCISLNKAIEDEGRWVNVKVYCASVFMTTLKRIFYSLFFAAPLQCSKKISQIRFPCKNLIIKRKSKKEWKWWEAMIKLIDMLCFRHIFQPVVEILCESRKKCNNTKNKPLRMECDCKYETSHKNDDNCCAVKKYTDSSRMIISKLSSLFWSTSQWWKKAIGICYRLPIFFSFAWVYLWMSRLSQQQNVFYYIFFIKLYITHDCMNDRVIKGCSVITFCTVAHFLQHPTFKKKLNTLKN